MRKRHSSGTDPVKPPNVIVILVDELRSFEVGCYGNRAIRTPNIDQLARDGVMFETAVTNNPVCSPARASILSGQYGRTATGSLSNDCMDPCSDHRRHFPDETLPEILKREGYYTAAIGKWHLDPPPETLGFDESCFPLNVHRNYGQTYIDDGEWRVVEEFGPEFELEKVNQFLSRRSTEKDPFFLYYNISPPHEPIGPMELPNRYEGLFSPTDVAIRPNAYVDGKLAYDHEWFKMYLIWGYWWRIAKTGIWDADPRCPYPGQTGSSPDDDAICPKEYTLRDLTAAYYNATACCDELLGRCMAILVENGLSENTIVVFASDHGDNLGSHGLFNKDCLFEEAIRVPMVFSHPGRLAPAIEKRRVAGLIDISPTILSLLDIEPPEHMAGSPLTPFNEGSATGNGDHGAAFIECDSGILGRCTVGVRTLTHTYGRWLGEDQKTLGEPWGFFDLRNDPYQQINLIETGDQNELATTLHEQVAKCHHDIPWLS